MLKNSNYPSVWRPGELFHGIFFCNIFHGHRLLAVFDKKSIFNCLIDPGFVKIRL